MSYKVQTISVFERQAKRLLKKFPSFKSELAILIQDLKKNPLLGTDLGNNCFKIRLAIASKGKGKSGGARVITHFTISNSSVYLLTIYDKSERDNISDKELNELLAFIP
jgi:hypothetical protein